MVSLRPIGGVTRAVLRLERSERRWSTSQAAIRDHVPSLATGTYGSKEGGAAGVDHHIRASRRSLDGRGYERAGQKCFEQRPRFNGHFQTAQAASAPKERSLGKNGNCHRPGGLVD